MLLMDFPQIANVRVDQALTLGLTYRVKAVAFGSGGYDAGTPATALALNTAATSLTNEVFRKLLPDEATAQDEITVFRGKETTYTNLGGDEYTGIIGEAGLIGAVVDPGTSGLAAGDEFLLMHAHFSRIILGPTDRVAIEWKADYSSLEPVSLPSVPLLSSLRQWIRSRDLDGAGGALPADTTAVVTVANKGTLGGQMAQSNPALRPTFKTNALGAIPAIRFNGACLVSDLGNAPFAFMTNGDTGVSHYFVIKKKAAGSSCFITTTGGSEQGFLIWDTGNVGQIGLYVVDSGGVRGNITSSAGILHTDTQFDLVCIRFGDAQTPDITIEVNGVQVASGNLTGSGTGGGAFALTIGGSATPNFFANFELIDYYCWEGAHSDAERDAVYAYINSDCAVPSFPAP